MSKREKDGNSSGVKLDRYRNSKFEMEDASNNSPFEGVSVRSINTLGGGPTSENRGQRGDFPERRKENPFVNGNLKNWNHKKGWDRFFDRSYDKEFRSNGGSQIGHDKGNFGKGPKGYKRSDQNIYEDVCETLALNPDIDASEISVKVKGGCVYLEGTVDDRSVKRMAELVVENISGVYDVQNLLTLKKVS